MNLEKGPRGNGLETVIGSINNMALVPFVALFLGIQAPDLYAKGIEDYESKAITEKVLPPAFIEKVEELGLSFKVMVKAPELKEGQKAVYIVHFPQVHGDNVTDKHLKKLREMFGAYQKRRQKIDELQMISDSNKFKILDIWRQEVDNNVFMEGLDIDIEANSYNIEKQVESFSRDVDALQQMLDSYTASDEGDKLDIAAEIHKHIVKKFFGYRQVQFTKKTIDEVKKECEESLFAKNCDEVQEEYEMHDEEFIAPEYNLVSIYAHIATVKNDIQLADALLRRLFKLLRHALDIVNEHKDGLYDIHYEKINSQDQNAGLYFPIDYDYVQSLRNRLRNYTGIFKSPSAGGKLIIDLIKRGYNVFGAENRLNKKAANALNELSYMKLKYYLSSSFDKNRELPQLEEQIRSLEEQIRNTVFNEREQHVYQRISEISLKKNLDKVLLDFGAAHRFVNSAHQWNAGSSNVKFGIIRIMIPQIEKSIKEFKRNNE